MLDVMNVRTKVNIHFVEGVACDLIRWATNLNNTLFTIVLSLNNIRIFKQTLRYDLSCWVTLYLFYCYWLFEDAWLMGNAEHYSFRSIRNFVWSDCFKIRLPGCALLNLFTKFVQFPLKLHQYMLVYNVQWEYLKNIAWLL